MGDKVFFLGAGFSKALDNNYPLLIGDNSLTTIVSEKIKANNILYNHFDTIPKSIKNNIEHLFSYLTMDAPWKTEKQKHLDKALFIALTELLTEYLFNLEKREKSGSKQNFDNLAKFIIDNKTPIITLNYDLLLENLLLNSPSNKDNNNWWILGYRYLYKNLIDINDRMNPGGFVDGGTFGSEKLKEEKTTEILKLHGSINWYYSGYSAIDPVYYVDNLNELDKDSIGDLVPYIIPPTLDKNSFYNNNILKLLWSKAHQYLRNAKEIYIIGFSFPMTDLPVRFLFQSALRGREKEVEIFVVNKEIPLSYKKIFDGFTNIHYEYCKDGNPLDAFLNGHLHKEEEATSVILSD
ncbi:MAG: hypothetical protein V2B14_05025 [bacterium]